MYISLSRHKQVSMQHPVKDVNMVQHSTMLKENDWRMMVWNIKIKGIGCPEGLDYIQDSLHKAHLFLTVTV